MHYSPTYLHSSVRRLGGISLITLLHAGAFVALMNGLGVRSFDLPVPPIIARVVELPKPNEARPEALAEAYRPESEPFQLRAAEPVIAVSEEGKDAWIAGVEERKAPASRIAEKPVVTMARVDPSHPLSQPAYPPQSRRLGEQGSVELTLFVLPNGRVEEARVTRSSGYVRLDEAAILEAKRKWRLLPGSENGAPVSGWTSVIITFKLFK